MHGAIATADMQPVPARPFFHKISQIPCFLKCVLQRFPSKHGNLHICPRKTVPKLIFTMFPRPLSPQTLENAAIYIVFFNFSMLANSNIYTKNPSKALFFQCFYICSVKNAVIYTFFSIKSVQNSGFCSVFKALASKNVQFRDLPKPLKTPLFTLFSSIFPCAHAAGQLKHIYKKNTKNHSKTLFFQCFYICSVKNAVIYTFFSIKSVQNSGFCSVFKALASKNVQFRDLPKPLKTPLFTLFSSIFPCAHAAGQLKHIYKKIQKIIQKHCLFQCFYICFFKNAVIYTFFGIKSVQNSGFCSVFKALASKNVQFRDLPKPLKTPLFTLFSSIFPCAHAAGQLKHIYKKNTKNHSKTLFFQCFYICSVKNAVIYTFFSIKSVQNSGFCSVFNALASKNHSKYRYLQCSFISVRFSLARSRPK